jgi:amidase
MLRHGASISAVELLEAYGDCNAIGRAIGTFFASADVLLLPSAARPPWKLGDLDQDDESLDPDAWCRTLFGVYAPFTAMFNISGQPAVSLPLAWSDAGLPVGVQLVGRYADEATLLRLAAQLQEISPWTARTPPLTVG